MKFRATQDRHVSSLSFTVILITPAANLD
jgi:hypothetical protein